MNEIVWLAHGGPGSGRYPKGSGKVKLIKKTGSIAKNTIGFNYNRTKYNRVTKKSSKISYKLNTKKFSIKKQEKLISRFLNNEQKLSDLRMKMSSKRSKIANAEKYINNILNENVYRYVNSNGDIIYGAKNYIGPF